MIKTVWLHWCLGIFVLGYVLAPVIVVVCFFPAIWSDQPEFWGKVIVSALFVSLVALMTWFVDEVVLDGRMTR